jgi:PTS system mannose-specific IIA component
MHVIGVIIVTHNRLADEFLQAVRVIVGPGEHIHAVGLDPTTTSPEDMRSRIDKAIQQADSGHGVLILVDMFGGTPSNLALSFLEENRVEVVTGLNLPMLVKVASSLEPLKVAELASIARDYGRRNVSVATDVLSGKDDHGAGS